MLIGLLANKNWRELAVGDMVAIRPFCNSNSDIKFGTIMDKIERSPYVPLVTIGDVTNSNIYTDRPINECFSRNHLKNIYEKFVGTEFGDKISKLIKLMDEHSPKPKDIRLYVLAHIDRGQQEKFLKTAIMAGYMAYPIRPNCLQLILDGDNLVFEHDGSIVDKKDFLAGKTRYCHKSQMIPETHYSNAVRAILSITTMSPDDCAYYYNWCSLECALNDMMLPLWDTVEHRIELEKEN